MKGVRRGEEEKERPFLPSPSPHMGEREREEEEGERGRGEGEEGKREGEEGEREGEEGEREGEEGERESGGEREGGRKGGREREGERERVVHEVVCIHVCKSEGCRDSIQANYTKYLGVVYNDRLPLSHHNKLGYHHASHITIST